VAYIAGFNRQKATLVLLTMLKAKLRHRGGGHLPRDRGERGSGAAGAEGGLIIAYCQIPAEVARNYNPSIVLLGDAMRSL